MAKKRSRETRENKMFDLVLQKKKRKKREIRVLLVKEKHLIKNEIIRRGAGQVCDNSEVSSLVAYSREYF